MKKVLIFSVACYQRGLSPLLGARCRYHPSCSHYALDCLNKYSTRRAIRKILWRLMRCQPYSRGGFDPA